MPKKAMPFVIGFYVTLVLFTTFVLLYQFVIPHGGFYVEDPVITTTTTVPPPTTTTTTTDPYSPTSSLSGTNVITTQPPTTTTSTTTTTTTSGLVYLGEVPTVLQTGDVIGTYENDSVLMTVYHIRATNSDVYVADVVARDAYTILSGLAYNTFGGTNVVQPVSEMAEEHDAIFAINSDYASHYSSGFVIRNGMILRSSASYRQAVVLNIDGSVSIITESQTTVQGILDDGAWQLWSFGPPLIIDGVSVASVNDGLDRDAVNNPRSAFGYIGPNHFMFVCVDGRTEVSHGADIEELAEIMMDLGCVQAYNFDGGGSATMYFNGSVINHPSEGDERAVSDCVYIRR